MKTRLDLNDALLANAKSLAARQRTTLTRLIEEGLELRLRAGTTSNGAKKKRVSPVPVYAVNGKGKSGLVAGLNPLSLSGAYRGQTTFLDARVTVYRDLSPILILDVDAKGNICSITVEHASKRAGAPQFSYEQVAA
jgi:uncharacterized protein YuzE